MRQIYIIRHREGPNEGKIWGTSLDKTTLIRAIGHENRSNSKYFKDYSDELIWQTIEKAGEFEMITANYYSLWTDEEINNK